MERRRKSQGFTALELTIAALVLAIVLLIAIPAYRHRQEERLARECRENISKIYDAGMRWHNADFQRGNEIPDTQDLVPFYIDSMPKCPAGYAYELNPSPFAPTCSSNLPGHKMNEFADEGLICYE